MRSPLKYLLLVLCVVSIKGIDTNTSNDDNNGEIPIGKTRESRTNRRVVKLYSGTRPKPIVCNGEGFQEDPDDCTIFHRCIKSGHGRYLSYKFQCGPGTIYDPEAETCNHPENTKRTACGGKLVAPNELMNERTNQEIPSPISTKKPFYSERTPDELISKSPSSFSQATENSPTNKDDQSILSSSKTFSSESFVASTTPFTNVLQQKLTHPLSSNVTNKDRLYTSQIDDICKSDGFVGDVDNCRKFYRCVGNQRGGFIRYEFMCSDPTIWDDDKQACNHAWLVNKRRCGRGGNVGNDVNIKESFSSYKLSNEINYSDRSPPDQSNELTTSSINTSDNNDPSAQPSQTQLQISYGSKVSQQQTQISKGNVKQNQTQINYNKNSDVKQNQTQISYGSAVSQSQSQINYGDKGVQTQVQIDHSNESSQIQTQIVESTTATESSQVPTKTPNSDNVCTESGFVGDSKDCKKFYRCVDNGRGSFTRYEFSCGEGTVWDPEIESCNHAWAVEKCGGKGPSETSSKNPTDLTQSTASVIISSSTSYTHISEEPTTEENDISYGNQPISTSTNKPIPQMTVATNKPQSLDENQCKESGFMGDISDCKKFYRCVDNGNGKFTRYEFSCGEGTVWDAKIEACNHAWAVEKCGGGITEDVNKVDTTTLKEIDNVTYSTTTIQNIVPGENSEEGGYGQENIESPHPISTTIISSTSTASSLQQGNKNQCTASGFRGDEYDCKKFYRCVDNGNNGFTQYEFTCGEGTVWDPKIESCNHIWAVEKCGGTGNNNAQSQHPPTSETSSVMNDFENPNGYPVQNEEYSTEKPNENMMSSTVPVDHGNQNQQSTEESSTSVVKPASNTCPQEGFYADPNNCKNFYRCVDNGQGGYTKYEFTCGEGTLWNQDILACDHESQVKQCGSNSSELTTKVPSSSETNEAATEITTNGTPSNTKPDLESTDRPSTSEQSTLSPSTSKDTCTEEGFFANSEDCKKFYRCVSNDKGGFTKYDFTCGDGTVWVQEILACDHDNGITNCSSSTSKPQTTEQIQSSTTSSQNTTESQDNDKDNGETSSSSSEKPPSSNNECTSEGFYVNKKDCRQFYRCVDDGKGGYTKYDFTCGEGTAWDPNVQTCNHISEVENCNNSNQEGSQIQPTMQDEEVSQTTQSTSTISESGSNESSKPKNDSCENEGFYGNSQDCTKFYRCVDDGKGGFTKYDFDCGEGTIWDQDITTCNHPQDVANPSCKNYQEGSTATSKSTTTTTTTTTNSPTTTSSSGSNTTLDSNQNNSQNNNNQNSSCTTESTSKKPEQSYQCEKAGFYADPNDCKKFYRCVDWDGKGETFSIYHFECGEGTIWDPKLETCNHEDSVYPPRDCSGSQNQNTTQEMTTTTQKSTTQEGTSTTQSTTSEKTTTQQSTTSEQTTTEQSTTQQSTTAEQTTTQQSTTTEQTTAPQTTTTEQTTAPQTTTTEQTTAPQTTTTEQTTAPQTTTEFTTTEQTTTEQTTTAQATTTEQTTTQQSTTHSEGTTNEQSSTTEQMTEQSTSTNEQTTESSTTTTTEKDNSSTTESEQNTTTEETSNQNKECPETEDDQYLYVCPTSFRRHPKYCNMFYQCTEDEESHEIKIATFTCPNNTIYDEHQAQCVEEDKADKKCNGQKARRHKAKRLNLSSKEPIVVDQHQHKCKNLGNYQFEKDYECSHVFLKCQQTSSGKLRGGVYQCPKGYIYWTVSKRCEKTDYLKFCQPTESRNWKDRWEIPVENKNLAK